MNYVSYGSGITGFLLLCEVSFLKIPLKSTLNKSIYFIFYNLFCIQVALGEVKEIANHVFHEKAPEGFDSVLVVSKEIPDPNEDVTTPYGAIVPAGVRVEQPGLAERFNVRRIYNNHSEYVVYKESQVLIRYIVQVKRTQR